MRAYKANRGPSCADADTTMAVYVNLARNGYGCAHLISRKRYHELKANHF